MISGASSIRFLLLCSSDRPKFLMLTTADLATVRLKSIRIRRSALYGNKLMALFT